MYETLNPVDIIPSGKGISTQNYWSKDQNYYLTMSQVIKVLEKLHVFDNNINQKSEQIQNAIL